MSEQSSPVREEATGGKINNGPAVSKKGNRKPALMKGGPTLIEKVDSNPI
jgi:hypothetical protein